MYLVSRQLIMEIKFSSSAPLYFTCRYHTGYSSMQSIKCSPSFFISFPLLMMGRMWVCNVCTYFLIINAKSILHSLQLTVISSWSCQKQTDWLTGRTSSCVIQGQLVHYFMKINFTLAIFKYSFSEAVQTFVKSK